MCPGLLLPTARTGRSAADPSRMVGSRTPVEAPFTAPYSFLRAGVRPRLPSALGVSLGQVALGAAPLTDHQNEDRRQPQDDSADPRLRDLIYRAGTVIRLRAQDSDWVWDVFIRAQEGDESRLSGLPIEIGELYPLLVMENLGRGASPFLVVSMCAQACAAGAIVTTETPELFDELQSLISEVRSNGVVEADIKYGLDKKLARRLKISPPGAVDAPAEPPHRASRKQPSTTPLPTDLPQHTFPEAKVAAMALADGPRLRRWLPVEGELALRHRVSEREPLQTKLLGAPLLDWLGQAHTLEGLQDELRQLGLPAVLLLHVCLGAALESASDQRLFVRHSIDEMVRAIGWQPRSREERAEARRKVWRWMAVFSALAGHRQACGPLQGS